MQAEAQLLEVVAALQASGRFARRLHGRQQERDQDADDRDDDQEFDERKTTRGGRQGAGGEGSTKYGVLSTEWNAVARGCSWLSGTLKRHESFSVLCAPYCDGLLRPQKSSSLPPQASFQHRAFSLAQAFTHVGTNAKYHSPFLSAPFRGRERTMMHRLTSDRPLKGAERKRNVRPIPPSHRRKRLG